MEIRNKQDDHVEIALLVVYCLAAEIGACLLIHLTSFMFSINPAKIRKLYGSLQDNKELALITEYENIMKANRVWCVFGVIVQWIYILVSVYFAFGFCNFIIPLSQFVLPTKFFAFTINCSSFWAFRLKELSVL